MDKEVISMKKEDMERLSQALMGGAVVSIVFAAIGYLGTDIWLASTQWLLVAAVLALFGVYAKLS
ncbi:hypothetical protein HYT60_02565 [Candidatus Woesebacteria bacterium]|nr:hypothetical protein [Candidatus Woesebacteria bacterium]